MSSGTMTLPAPETVDIHQLVPQQPPFVLVSRMTHFGERTTVCQYDIPADGVLVDNGCLSAAGLMESIAQTCAARMGYYNKYVLRGAVQIGFIGAMRDLHVYSLPSVGTTITINVEVLENVFGLTLATATVHTSDGTLLAEGEMKIALQETKEGEA